MASVIDSLPIGRTIAELCPDFSQDADYLMASK